MVLPTYPVGILFSQTGPYGTVGRAMLHGALLALEEVNAGGVLSLHPVLLDPGGDLDAYRAAAAKLLQGGVQQVVGCYTSSSRKEIIPFFEKYDGLLWYPSHYEGFESSEHVIYTGAVANQHLLPLIDFMVTAHGNRVFCVGSNYIWAWENNRVFRENILKRSGAILAERYFSMGETDLDSVIRAIFASQPSFVFSTLVGTSAYQFFRAFRTAALARGIDQPQTMPVASCSLSEPELDAIGPSAIDGHLSSSVYFSSLPTPESQRFVAGYAARFPDGPAVCADAEASYIAVKLLALSLAEARTTEAALVRQAVRNRHIVAPQGEIWVDPDTLHTWLTPRIGRSNRNGRFDLLLDAQQPVRPDPYLVWHSARFEVPDGRQHLRVVR